MLRIYFIFLEQKVQAEYSFAVPFNNLNTINIKYKHCSYSLIFRINMLQKARKIVITLR